MIRLHDVSVAIPVRPGDNVTPAIYSLGRQDGVRLQVSICHDSEGRGANWARNQAAAKAKNPYLLFSDADISWEPGAVLHLVRTLEEHPAAAYAYGSWEMHGRVQCTEEFDVNLLRRRNFVSTMSLLRRETFPGFDETIRRLQDWDLWLTMAGCGHFGVQCGRLIFRTLLRDGITQNGRIAHADARAIISAKHKLGLR